eukprot:CAMPEP_0194280578 /NCGR_PEP_ID=MMETSP0169-20130528/17968_1 /TAXON_ID=218684 /ORGANISM="Corethron pennatum, Strain L29A3" /LENGTH=725 /DNA_ID=CAMNT_0039025351 /DNA_START=144 /DNA_END=2321 /DNA_ORIENTATION=+
MGNTQGSLDGEIDDRNIPARMPPKRKDYFCELEYQTSKESAGSATRPEEEIDEDDIMESDSFLVDSTIGYSNVGEQSGDQSTALSNTELVRIRRKRTEKLRRIAEGLIEAASANTIFSHFEYCELHREVDHNDEVKHDDEVEAGIATALSATLEVLLRMSKTDVKIRKASIDLELVYRCSDECRADSFETIGHKLVPLLLKITKHCANGAIKHSPEMIIKRTVKILGYFALLENARASLVQHPGLLDTLIKVINSDVSMTSRIDSIWMIANLAFTDSLRGEIAQHPCLISTLMCASYEKNKEISSETAAAFMNLSAATENRTLMANNSELVRILCFLVTEGGDARSRATGTLKNLASAPENRERLLSYDNAIILDALAHTAVDTMDDKAAFRASGALKNFVCSETAPFLCQHRVFFSTIEKIISEEVKVKPKVVADACLMLKGVSEGVNVRNIPLSSFNKVATLLVNLNRQIPAYSLLVAEALANLAKEECNILPLVDIPDLIGTVANLMSSKDNKIRSMSIEMLTALSLPPACKEKIGSNIKILHALHVMLDSRGRQNSNSDFSKRALNIVNCLATEKKNLVEMGNLAGFLEGLIGYARNMNIEYRSEVLDLSSAIISTMKPPPELSRNRNSFDSNTESLDETHLVMSDIDIMSKPAASVIPRRENKDETKPAAMKPKIATPVSKLGVALKENEELADRNDKEMQHLEQGRHSWEDQGNAIPVE